MNLLGPDDANKIEVKSEVGKGTKFSFFLKDKDYNEFEHCDV